VLEVHDISVDYRQRQPGWHRSPTAFRAVDHVSFDIQQGTTVALVGESGSGKTSVARAILGLVPLAAGRILINDTEVSSRNSPPVRLARRRVQMVFQQPSGSLDPRMRIGSSVAEPLRYLSDLRGKRLQARVDELLDVVGLDGTFAQRYPRDRDIAELGDLR
jgi:peptide/nickel transport system ATP-binding protein